MLYNSVHGHNFDIGHETKKMLHEICYKNQWSRIQIRSRFRYPIRYTGKKYKKCSKSRVFSSAKIHLLLQFWEIRKMTKNKKCSQRNLETFLGTEFWISICNFFKVEKSVKNGLFLGVFTEMDIASLSYVLGRWFCYRKTRRIFVHLMVKTNFK